ncbi:peroxin, partial [Tulasnella sp. 417]
SLQNHSDPSRDLKVAPVGDKHTALAESKLHSPGKLLPVLQPVREYLLQYLHSACSPNPRLLTLAVPSVSPGAVPSTPEDPDQRTPHHQSRRYHYNMGRIEDLPPKVLDHIIEILFNEAPKDLVSSILGSVSKPIHESACRTIFGSTTRPLIVPDDARLFDNTAGSNPLILTLRGKPASALVMNPERYGPYVKCLSIVDPTAFAPLDAQDAMSMGSSNLGLFNGDFGVIAEEGEEDEERESDDDDGAENGQGRTRKPRAQGQVRPLDAETIRTLLSACEELEDLSWASSYPPPDGLCEDLVSYNTKLNRFAYEPNSQLTSASSNATKWDAPSLPLLAPLITSCNLAHLTLTRLTQTGAQSLSLLLNALAEEAELPSSSGASGWLQSLELNFVWLDDPLCQRIVKASRRTLKRLTLGTQGTKLTDAGVVTLLEGLEKLEEFGLVHVEGRLSKTLWTKLSQDTIPVSLSKLTIGIPDVGPSHSWSLDHLRSLSSFPFTNIRHLAIVRTSTSTEGPSLDRANNLQPVPREVLKALTEDEATEITCLECDWWSWSAEDLKVLLERCTKLKSVKLAFDAPFAKFLGLASPIASASNLRKISILIPADHVPSPPPSP